MNININNLQNIAGNLLRGVLRDVSVLGEADRALVLDELSTMAHAESRHIANKINRECLEDARLEGH